MATDIYSRIRQAAFELVGEGVWPTVMEVRARIGAGSNTTINNTLKEWRQEFLSRVAVSSRRPDWPAGLAEAFEQVWQRACDEADGRLESLRQDAETAVAQAAAETRELEAGLAARQAELQSALRELELRAARLADLEGRLQGEETRRQMLERAQMEQESRLEQSRKELSELRRQAEQRQQELEERAELKVQEAREEAARREALAYERLEGLRLRLYEQMEEERRAMQQAQARQEEALQQSRRERTRLEGEWRDRLAERERDNGRLEARLEWLEGRNAALEQDALRQAVQLEQTSARLLDMASENSRLAGEVNLGAERQLARLVEILAGSRQELLALDEAGLREWLGRQLQLPLLG
ncbi:DNA-binding protein [Chromobacterium rhizoryzae]|uniref:DNA-binding protein n=1 Tax=Chromobacterium rhizoryzae TaxID=1778675 RepID=UPI001D07539E|nr:DNA-binding protein [Chromobacterium rhizoryzae]